MVHASMWHAIHAGVQTKHFWEERFGLALKDTSLDIAARLARKHRRQREREVDVDDPAIEPTYQMMRAPSTTVWARLTKRFCFGSYLTSRIGKLGRHSSPGSRAVPSGAVLRTPSPARCDAQRRQFTSC